MASLFYRKFSVSFLFAFLAFALTSCTPSSPTRETDLVPHTPTATPFSTPTYTLPPAITPILTATLTPTITITPTSLPSTREINAQNAKLLTEVFRFGRNKPQDYFLDVAWSPLGEFIAFRYSVGIAILVPFNEKIEHDIQDAVLIGDLVWSPVEDRIAAGNWYGGILVWDIKNNWERGTLPGWGEEFYNPAVVWSSDGAHLAFISRFDYQGTYVDRIIVADAEDGSEQQNLISPKPLNCLSWSKDERLLATGSTEGAIYLWEASSGERIATLAGNQGTVYEVDFSPDGKFLASVGGRSLRIWDTDSGRMVYSIPQLQGHWPQVEWSPNGMLIATGTDDQTIHIFDAVTGDLLISLPGHNGEITGVSWSPDNHFLVSSSYDGTLIIWAVSEE